MVNVSAASRAYVDDSDPQSPRSKLKRLSLERDEQREQPLSPRSSGKFKVTNLPLDKLHDSSSDNESPADSAQASPRSASSNDGLLFAHLFPQKIPFFYAARFLDPNFVGAVTPRSRSGSARLKNLRYSPRIFDDIQEEKEKEHEPKEDEEGFVSLLFRFVAMTSC